MSDLPATRVYPCETVESFLKKLRPPTAVFEGGVTNTVIYRGVGDAGYELVPSALRTDAQSKKNVARIQSLRSEEFSGCTVDVTVLRLFYQEANRNGLSLPYIPQHMHEALCVGEVIADVAGHMNGTLLPVFGLAQHYGLPTRLLDWTFDPFVAAYFAAKSGLDHLEGNAESEPQPTHIAVWLVQSQFLDPSQVHVVHAPYSGNPNLAAQKGVFTFVQQIFIDTPLNAVQANAGPYQRKRRDFHKFTLPIGEAPNLLLELRMRGYDAARLFPGYSGAAKAVEELARMAQRPETRKRVFRETGEPSSE